MIKRLASELKNCAQLEVSSGNWGAGGYMAPEDIAMAAFHPSAGVSSLLPPTGK